MTIFEKWSLTRDQREDWTAAVLVLRGAIKGDPRFGVVTKKKQGGGISIGRANPLPKVVPRTGDGPVWLGHELVNKGVKAPTWDTVYWLDERGRYVKIGKDWGEWKKKIRSLLDDYGIADPRADENARAWGIALGIAGSVVAGALVVTGVGAAAAPYVLGATSSAAGALFASADSSEQSFASSYEKGTGEDYTVTGSGKAQQVVAAGSQLGGTIVQDIASGTADYDVLASQAAGLYNAITGTAPAPVAAPAPAPAPPAVTTGDKVIAFAKSPVGIAAILVVGFLVFRAARK